MEFTRRVKEIIQAIPRGRVATYGMIAGSAGDARQARQVAWILHSSSDKGRLPWHRVISARGRISLPRDRGGAEQARRLRAEGVRVGPGGEVALDRFGWKPKGRPSASPFPIDLDRLLEDEP